jgi:hypothetical protein
MAWRDIYLENEIKYVLKMMKYVDKYTTNPNGSLNECLVLQNVVSAYDFDLIKYMKSTYPHIDLRYDDDIIFIVAYAKKNIDFIEWLFSICPDMSDDIQIMRRYEDLSMARKTLNNKQ